MAILIHKAVVEREDVIKNIIHLESVKSSIATVTVVAIFALLQGCGSKTETRQPNSQVAAKVNDEEITIYRVNTALGASGAAVAHSADPQVQAQARRSVLDSLVDQELAAQAAEKNKLDRTPAVVQAIEAARREVLARAWMDQLSSSLPKADASQTSKYYAEHPELFSQRRVYDLQQIMLPAVDAPVRAEMKQKIDDGISMQQMVNWLNEKQIKFAAASGMRTAEQIPLDVLGNLSKAKDGQTLLLEQPKSAMIVHVVSSTLQPVNETLAAPRINKFLTNQAWTNAIAAEMKRLKQDASITYLGEFSSSATQKPVALNVDDNQVKTANKATAAADNGDKEMSALYKEVAR